MEAKEGKQIAQGHTARKTANQDSLYSSSLFKPREVRLIIQSCQKANRKEMETTCTSQVFLDARYFTGHLTYLFHVTHTTAPRVVIIVSNLQKRSLGILPAPKPSPASLRSPCPARKDPQLSTQCLCLKPQPLAHCAVQVSLSSSSASLKS